MCNTIVFSFAKKLKSSIKTDLISKFNMKTLDFVDQLVVDVLDKIKFKDLSTHQVKDLDGEVAVILKQLKEGEKRQELDAIKKLSQKVPDDVLGKSQFIQQSIKTTRKALPIFSKIKDRKFILKDYQMDDGVCQSLRQALGSVPRLVNQLFLENCGVSK